MNKQTNNIGSLVAAALVGSIITFAGVSFFVGNDSAGNSNESTEKQPIYWQAPMDPNYTSDKSGKSPMGMDLIPVYADGGSGSDSGPGTIKVNPDVVNNLGVRTATAEKGILDSEISTVGYVKYNEDKLIQIHPRVKDWVEKLYVKAEGDAVVKDQPLYEIYSPALVNAQEELLLALDRKNRRLIRAAEDRLKALHLPESAVKKLIKSRKVSQLLLFMRHKVVLSIILIYERAFMFSQTQ